MMKRKFLLIVFSFVCIIGFAQGDDAVIKAIQKEATENSQLEKLAHELLDKIGPRLVGSPQMQQAHDWVVNKYTGWNIAAKNEKWGEWRGWERGRHDGHGLSRLRPQRGRLRGKVRQPDELWRRATAAGLVAVRPEPLLRGAHRAHPAIRLCHRRADRILCHLGGNRSQGRDPETSLAQRL